MLTDFSKIERPRPAAPGLPGARRIPGEDSGCSMLLKAALDLHAYQCCMHMNACSTRCALQVLAELM